MTDPITSGVAARYPCHERGTTFSVRIDGSASRHPRTCGDCGQEYEVTTTLLDAIAGKVQCEWRHVTRVVGEVVAVTAAYL